MRAQGCPIEILIDVSIELIDADLDRWALVFTVDGEDFESGPVTQWAAMW